MAKKNFLKNFDYKKYLIEKGERVGLGVAAGVMALTLGLGIVSLATSGSPDDNSKPLEKKTSDIKGLLLTRKPEPGFGDPDPALLKPIDARQVKPEEVLCSLDYFEPTSSDVTKRYNPPVLGIDPQDSRAELLRVQVRNLMIQREGDEPKIFVLADVKGDAKASARARTNRRQFGGLPGGGLPGANRFGQGRQDNFRNISAAFDKTAAKEYTLRPVKLDELGSQKLAVEIRPYRMAYVVASFPYRQQMELFKTYLRFPSLSAMFADKNLKIAFLGFNVQRRTLGPNGEVREDWQTLDLKNDYQKAVLSDAASILPDDPALRPVVVPGLAVPRPQLAEEPTGKGDRGDKGKEGDAGDKVEKKGYVVFRNGQAIAPEDELVHLQKTLADWNKKDSKVRKKTISAQGEKLKGDFDLFDPYGDRKEAEKKPEDEPEDRPDENAKPKDLELPEWCLVRFIDPTIQEGNYYQYRIQIKMANPNYDRPDLVAFEALAKDKELTPKDREGNPIYTEIPDIIRVPNDLYLYAVDTRAGQPRYALGRDRTAVQVHLWLERQGATVTAKEEQKFPVGDWSVADRVVVERGEMIGHWMQVKVPVWSPHRDSFIFLPPPGVKAIATVPVDFHTGCVMVDFEGGTVNTSVPVGGKSRSVSDEAPLEQLILTPQGKLVVHDGRKDSVDEERKTHYENWQKKLRDVDENEQTIRNGGKRPDIRLDDPSKKP
jgi:hypothetical protein